jgi:hypothetical protein
MPMGERGSEMLRAHTGGINLLGVYSYLSFETINHGM